MMDQVLKGQLEHR